MVVSCSTTDKVEGNKRSVTNCGRKAARKDGWEFLGAARHWGVLSYQRISATERENQPGVVVLLSRSPLLNYFGQCLVSHTHKNELSLRAEQRNQLSTPAHYSTGSPCTALAFHHTLKAHLRMRVNGTRVRSASNTALPLYRLPVFLK